LLWASLQRNTPTSVVDLNAPQKPLILSRMLRWAENPPYPLRLQGSFDISLCYVIMGSHVADRSILWHRALASPSPIGTTLALVATTHRVTDIYLKSTVFFLGAKLFHTVLRENP
jgi:hypothetical protein